MCSFLLYFISSLICHRLFLCFVVHDKNLPVVRNQNKWDSVPYLYNLHLLYHIWNIMIWNWTEDCILAALQREHDLKSKRNQYIFFEEIKQDKIQSSSVSKKRKELRWNCPASTVAGEPQERKGTSRPWNLWRPQAIVASLECCACPVPVASGAPSRHPIQSTFQQPATWMHVMWWSSSFTLLPNSDRGWLHQSPLTFSLGSMPISLPVTSC